MLILQLITILLVMRSVVLTAALAFFLVQPAFPYPVPLPGTEPIRQLMEKADLVCKGLVASAPPIVAAPYTKEKTGVAKVRVDRCFKGQAETNEIAVLFNQVLPPGGGPALVLKTGDYFLFFLTRQSNGKYLPFDDFFSTLPISRLLGDPP